MTLSIGATVALDRQLACGSVDGRWWYCGGDQLASTCSTCRRSSVKSGVAMNFLEESYYFKLFLLVFVFFY